MGSFKYIFVFIIILSCTTDDTIIAEDSLSTYVTNKITEIGAVIACAGSDNITNDILVFFYPENGALDIRLYETTDATVDKGEFSNYDRIAINDEPFFNGYLGKFTHNSTVEKWIIVTFELNGEIKISNPIRIKQQIKPTIWTDNVTIDQQQSTMPIFTWENNEFGDNAIYFQIISDAQNNFLSGTYTFENEFQYYNISNVVLNITVNNPPNLLTDASYNFTLMDVSEDNWVNLIIQKSFTIQ